MFSPLLGAETLETVWRLETHWAWPPWLTALLIAAGLSIVISAYRYEASPARGAYRALLAGLRLTTLFLLLLMLSEALFSGARTGRSRLAILIDRSASMQRADLQLEGETEKKTREAFARDLFAKEDGKLLSQMAKEYDVELYWVDNRLTRSAADLEEVVSELTDSNSAGDPGASRLGESIEALLNAPAASPLQGVLLLSDGQNTIGRSLRSASDSARKLGVPIYTLGLGSELALPETELVDLLADETAFVDDLVKFEATLRTRGMPEAVVQVELFQEGVTAPVARQNFSIKSNEQSVRLLHRPTKPGEFRYRLVAKVVDGSAEALESEPSTISHTLLVRDDKVRVLLAAGYPNYEYRYLKHLLERDQTLKLSTLLQESDLEFAESDRTALARFPIRAAELGEYDVLILIDIDPTLLPRSVWKTLAKYVSDQGGGIAMVAGPRSMPSAYRSNAPFAALLPTELKTVLPGGWAEAAGYRVTPTELGRRSAPLQLADTAEQSDQVWRTLPEIYWRAEVGKPKPASQVLAQHSSTAGVPLIVSQYYGAGRVVLHAFDSSWRWRRRVGDVFFARYWVQTIRSLARGKLKAGSEGSELVSTKTEYRYGEPVRLRLRSNQQSESESPALLLQSPGQPERRIELQVGSGGRNMYQTSIADLAPGDYRAVMAATQGDRPLVAEFKVVAPLGESSNPELNREVLMSVAQRSRGKYFSIDQAEQIAEQLPRGRREAVENLPPIELWNRWPILTAICVCLCSEWILRKRRSML